MKTKLHNTTYTPEVSFSKADLKSVEAILLNATSTLDPSKADVSI
jgi:hypothetical protein